MNELSSLAVILLFALAAGHLVKVLRIPEVTGYLLAGVLVGPSGLRWVNHENLAALKVFSQVGLGLILFSIGGSFDFKRFRRTGRVILIVTLFESTATALAVFLGMILIGQPPSIALVFASIVIETGAASTLMVMRESDSAGPLTDTVTGVIGLNNVLALVAFSLVIGCLDMYALSSAGSLTAAEVYRQIYLLGWQFLGSCAMGFLVGVALAAWGARLREESEMVTLLIGSILLAVGVATVLNASPLIATLAMGATVVNLSDESEKLFKSLSRTDPPLYVVFFVLAGAELDLSLLRSLGLAGLVYVVARTAGKFIGASAAARVTQMRPTVEKNIGFALFAQAGLAIGLVLIAREHLPESGALITTVVLGGVAIFEMFGPIAAKFALVRSGEVPTAEPGH
jgi:Kef-type K+ transport system membrane component KefB